VNILESKLYNFSFTFEGITFSFGIPASCKQEACDKLSRAMTAMQEELKPEVKKLSN
jgi:hypothetical protein